MVSKTTIARNLRELDSRYKRKSRNPRDPLYYSKLSLIELCGWIEGTMDLILNNCARKHLSDPGNVKYMDEIIKRTSGFSYENHFREMLIRAIGIVMVEKLEGAFDPVKFQLLKSSLNTLSEQRNSAAHTHLANVTLSLLAPSAVNAHFIQVYDGLKDIERCVRHVEI